MTGRSEQRLTKRQQRLAEKTNRGVEKFPTIGQLNFNLSHIEPITENQKLAFNAYERGQHLCLLGSPGTGKTFLSIYNALKTISDRSSPQRKVVIVRTAQPSKQIGFLPGSDKEKLSVYEAAYKGIFSELYKRGDAYDVLKTKGMVEFVGTSFLRGITIDDAVIIIDEIQSMSFPEIFTILSRLGSNSRLIICGDANQDDLTSARFKEVTGLPKLKQVLSHMSSVESVYFGTEDIVRSGFVKDLIIAFEKTGLSVLDL